MLKYVRKYAKLFIRFRMIFLQKSTNNLGLLKKLDMNFSGFTADQYTRYDFKRNKKEEYISEWERLETRTLNGRYNIIFDDKLVFYEIFKQYVNVPINYAWIRNGIIYDMKSNIYSDDEFLLLLQTKKKLVLKPVILAGGGKDISLVSSILGRYALNYVQKNPSEIITYIKSKDDFLLCEYVEQHSYSKRIFEKSVNTIRIVTINEGSGSKIVAAVHRFGMYKTIPVDNASRGALVTQIDLQTGILGKSKTYYDKKIFTHHPDTGSNIEGIEIPFWFETKKALTETHNYFPYIKFIAWDVVTTTEGFMVIEGNTSTGLALFQLWKGARDTKLGEFYKRQGVIK